MIYAILLVALQLGVLYACIKKTPKYVILLPAINLIAVNFAVQKLVLYPIGVSSVGALTYSFMYLVFFLIYVNEGYHRAWFSLKFTIGSFIYVTLLSYLSVNVVPTPSFNVEKTMLYKTFFDLNLVPYFASLIATVSAAGLFLYLTKEFFSKQTLAIRFYFAYSISAILNSVMFFFGFLGEELANPEKLELTIKIVFVNVILKLIMGLIYSSFSYLKFNYDKTETHRSYIT